VVIHLLRYDDFSAYSSEAVEEKLVGILLRHRIPCTFGVIPFACLPESLLNAGEVKLSPLTAARAALLAPLLKAGLAEIALHGYCHLALAPLRGYQEFSDRMSPEVQRQLIRRGRSHLESVFGVKVRLFVPPWNRLSPSTAAVLQAEGLWLSSGGPEVTASSATLAQLPCPTSLADTGRALATARRFGGDRNCVGTVLHDYDFKESGLGGADFSLDDFDRNLNAWKTVEHRLISDTISPDTESEGRRARANVELRTVVNSSRLRRKLAGDLLHVYWDAATVSRLIRKLKFIP